jgi:hypothetical protein
MGFPLLVGWSMQRNVLLTAPIGVPAHAEYHAQTATTPQLLPSLAAAWPCSVPQQQPGPRCQEPRSQPDGSSRWHPSRA